MFDIIFLRHGESEGNHARWIQGQTDSALTERGWQQARFLANFWYENGTKFDFIISSTLSRALETARTICDLNHLPLETDPLWQERCFGEIEGYSSEDLQQAKPPLDFYHPFIPPASGAESQLDLFLRASQALQKLITREEGNYLVVSHGSMLNMVMYTIFGLAPQGNYQSPRFMFDNTGFAHFTYQPENRQWRLWSFNCTSHLK